MTSITGALCWLITAVIAAVLGQDARTAVPRLCKFLLRRSIAKVPEKYADTLLEEWLAHLDECEYLTQKLHHAGSIYLYGAAQVARTLNETAGPTRTYLRAKRFLDLFMPILAVWVLAPVLLFLVIALPMKRLAAAGVHGNEIGVYVLDLEAIARTSPKLADFLAKLSLSSLPMIFSIIKGDVSFVGPPLLKVGNHKKYHGMKPGLTRAADIHYCLGEHIPCDMVMREYARRANMSLDVKIFIRTLVIVARW